MWCPGAGSHLWGPQDFLAGEVSKVPFGLATLGKTQTPPPGQSVSVSVSVCVSVSVGEGVVGSTRGLVDTQNGGGNVWRSGDGKPGVTMCDHTERPDAFLHERGCKRKASIGHNESH